MSWFRDRPPLGPGLWLFILTRILGILLSAGTFALFAVPALPPVAVLEGGAELGGGLFGALLLPLAEIAGNAAGLVLLGRRSRGVRRYWLAYLGALCVVRLWQALEGPEAARALLFLAAGLAWLAYWVWAPRPRQLALEGLWTFPESDADRARPS